MYKDPATDDVSCCQVVKIESLSQAAGCQSHRKKKKSKSSTKTQTQPKPFSTKSPITPLQTQITPLETPGVSKLTVEKGSLLDNLSPLCERHASLEEQNKSLWNDLSVLCEGHALLEEENQSLKSKVTSLEDQNKELQGIIDELQNLNSTFTELDEASKLLEKELKSRIETLDTEILKLNGQTRTLTTEKRRLNDKLRNLEKVNENYFDSQRQRTEQLEEKAEELAQANALLTAESTQTSSLLTERVKELENGMLFLKLKDAQETQDDINGTLQVDKEQTVLVCPIELQGNSPEDRHRLVGSRILWRGALPLGLPLVTEGYIQPSTDGDQLLNQVRYALGKKLIEDCNNLRAELFTESGVQVVYENDAAMRLLTEKDSSFHKMGDHAAHTLPPDFTVDEVHQAIEMTTTTEDKGGLVVLAMITYSLAKERELTYGQE